MAFNPNVINTNMPPPNYPVLPMQFPSHQTNPCPTPPISQQHMFNTGMHVPLANPSPFNMVPSNHLPSPSPPVGLGFVQNPMQSSSPMWNNNNLNPPMVNNQIHSFPSAPPVPYAQNNQVTALFQTPPPPLPNKQFQTSWDNSINQQQNNHNGLLAVAPISSNDNNQQNFTNFSQNLQSPVKPAFQSSTEQFGNHNNNNVSAWSNNNQPYRPPTPLNHAQVNNNQNHFNPSRGSNAFPGKNSWNLIQKTSVPDSNIFQNPSAIFAMTGNNYDALNPNINDAAKNSFQDYNMTNRFPVKLPDVIPVNQGEKFHPPYKNNNASLNGDCVSYDKQGRYLQQSNDFNRKHVKRFHQNNIQDNDYFKSTKPDFGEGQNLQSFQHNNQNLIDVCVVPKRNTFEGKPPNRMFFQSNNYCRSNSGSTNVEEFTISDSESIESINSKSSPQKQLRNKRVSENLQTINSESSENKFENKMSWMTESIQKALQKRNMLFKQARTTNDPAVWAEYNKLKNEINEEIKQAKSHNKNNRPRVNTPRTWQNKEKKLPFNCDTCDRGFSNKDELEAHIAFHIKCHHRGCNFEAHPKIVSLHQKMQHDTGYADVINKLQNDEEIKKWREERKRRFPTAENILKKKAEQAEKEARGEVIEEREYGQFKRRKFDNRNKDQPNRTNVTNRRDRNRKRKQKNAFQRAPEIDLAEESDSEDENECQTKLRKFQGMKNGLEDLLVNDDAKIEVTADVKIEETYSNAPVKASEVPLNQITLSSDHQDDDNDAPLEIPIQKVSLNESSDSADENENKPLANENQQVLLDEATLKGSFPAEPNADEKSNNNEKSLLSSEDYKGSKRERNEKRCRPPVPPRPRHSLLQMLLSDEIRHERNVIMQCVRHIVRNNFFGIGDNT